MTDPFLGNSPIFKSMQQSFNYISYLIEKIVDLKC